MPAWVTETGYVTTQEVRPKVGTRTGPGEHLVLLDLETGEKHEIDLAELPGISEDPLAALREQAAKGKSETRRRRHRASNPGEVSGDAEIADDAKTGDAKTAGDAKADNDKPRPVTFDEQISWSPEGRMLAVQAHSIDNKDRWIALIDPAEKVLRPIHRLSHEAWINWSFNEFGWLPDGRGLFFLSEESGTSQLYLYSLDDGAIRRLSGGEGVVSDVLLGPRARTFTYTANPDHPGSLRDVSRHHRQRPNRAVDRPWRPQRFADLSPDGESLLVTHSSTTHPPELYIQAAQPGSVARRITHTVSDQFKSLPWVGARDRRGAVFAPFPAYLLPLLPSEGVEHRQRESPRGCLHSRCRLPAERPSGLVGLLS